MTFTLSKPATAEALSDFLEDVARALDDGEKTILVDIDAVEVLESTTIATLIRALRDAREHSATVSLQASRKSVLETLRITALDRVFTIVTPLPVRDTKAPAARAGHVAKRPRFVAVLALAFSTSIVAGAVPIVHAGTSAMVKH